jgi:hypothetical protein
MVLDSAGWGLNAIRNMQRSSGSKGFMPAKKILRQPIFL